MQSIVAKRKRRTYEEMGKKTCAQLKKELKELGDVKGMAHRSKEETKVIYETWCRERYGALTPSPVLEKNGMARKPE